MKTMEKNPRVELHDNISQRYAGCSCNVTRDFFPLSLPAPARWGPCGAVYRTVYFKYSYFFDKFLISYTRGTWNSLAENIRSSKMLRFGIMIRRVGK